MFYKTESEQTHLTFFLIASTTHEDTGIHFILKMYHENVPLVSSARNGAKLK